MKPGGESGKGARLPRRSEENLGGEHQRRRRGGDRQEDETLRTPMTSFHLQLGHPKPVFKPFLLPLDLASQSTFCSLLLLLNLTVFSKPERFLENKPTPVGGRTRRRSSGQKPTYLRSPNGPLHNSSPSVVGVRRDHHQTCSMCGTWKREEGTDREENCQSLKRS